MNSGQSNMILFLGRFHPLLVHLPIGGLVLLGILEFLSACTRRKDVAQNRKWILGLVCSSAVVTAACGWLVARDPELQNTLMQGRSFILTQAPGPGLTFYGHLSLLRY